jgi:protein-disulfide isomerase
MHDQLCALTSTLSDDEIARVAVVAGATEAKVRTAMKGHAHKREIDADADVAEDFQVQGTPNFFINGRHLVGAVPQEQFERIIDDEIGKAQALVTAGTAPAKVYEALTKDGKEPPPPETKDLPALPPKDPSRGSPGAKVVIHEWADFQCPFCERVLPTLSEVMKNYGSKVKFVWHDLPLPMHSYAPLASQAAREAYKQRGAQGFWEMHDKLFANRMQLKRDDLDGYARALGLDMKAWAAALDGQSHAPEVTADANAANAASIVGTPAFLVMQSGAQKAYFISGAQPYGKFRKLIERALAEAK